MDKIWSRYGRPYTRIWIWICMDSYINTYGNRNKLINLCKLEASLISMDRIVDIWIHKMDVVVDSYGCG